LKFLIAGLGSIGRRHLRNLITLGEQDILLYRTHLSTLPDEELQDIPVETDLKAALAQQPDAVIVSNPTTLHLDVALPAAQAGAHLLIEKPISDVLDERVEELKLAVLRRGVKVLVGFQFRFHPVLNQIREQIAQGELGCPYSFRAHWGEYLPGWHPWEDYRQSYAARRELGGGVVNTLCHPFDYARWLFGEVASLSAVTTKVSKLDINVEDLAEVTLTCSNGCVGSIHLDCYQRPAEHWLEITCEKGYIRWENDSGAAKIYHVVGERWETIYPPAGFERNDLFITEMKHFIDLIHGSTNSCCDLEDGIHALELIEAIHASAKQERTVYL